MPLVDVTPDEVVAVKPAGVPCEMPRDPAADSLVRRLAADGLTGLRLVHRLDAPACGLVLLARSREAAAHHAAEIAARRWRKWYVARLALAPEAAATLVGPHKAYLATDGRRARAVRAGGKPSFLDVVHAAPVPGHAGESHVLVNLRTGRLHQIRVMLAHAGAPLAGDTTYGGPPGRIYLEHALLAGRTVGGVWTVWTAPEHPGRDPWAPALRDAIEARADLLRQDPPRA